MVKRMILMLAVMTLLIAGLGFMKFRQIQAATQMVFQPPPEAVTTVIAKQASWPSTTKVIGTMEAVQGVIVSADLPGIVSKIGFESGQAVRKGQVLVELDTRQEQAQLAAQQAQSDLARLNYGRLHGLVDQGAVTRQEFDQATAAQREADAGIAEIRATIDRKTIRAPFSGILGIRKVNLGQYLSAGDPVVSLQSWDPIYVNFGVPQQVASRVRAAGIVTVTTDALPGKTFSGKVTAIDSVVDESTRTVQLQATLPNPGGKLRPGMFVEVQAKDGAPRSVIALPASAISYAPYGDSVYVVGDMKDPKGQSYRGVRQQFVKTEGGRGDQVAIVSGINPGDEVVTSGTFKLRNGAAVLVNNQVQPSNNPAPTPEDN